MEVSRKFSIPRGLSTLLAVPFFILGPLTVGVTIKTWMVAGVMTELISILTLALMIWCVVILIRTDLNTPLDEPIRFNRARQKIYVYRFKPRWTAPWRRWPIEFSIYDWPQVRAELWSSGSGVYYRCGTILSVVDTGTGEVIDRFPMNRDTLSEEPWLYIHTYMEKGPSALPPFDTPRDPNELVWYSPFRRWAPKVKWPEAIDRESTTAP
ncbi:hypothetical protein SAMN05660463_03512 [Pseudomonas sp. URIL14HWK12:I9]|nr:hypothetical protein F474_04225 [Pseudomonas sp. URIL14HWK12:I12]PVZ22060.1 hypothetical protein F470_04225 [Pseudomonas sp. URIL14HWK12:I10]PVZ30857.1 hypothetical protein F472_03873 [Pseudomonas sp. URIL14HWK12:I11]SNZ17170.1 hypothetical protein SAMN05660463_03512 [Pseudomonas sp. URIL14HWK12:I9]